MQNQPTRMLSWIRSHHIWPPSIPTKAGSDTKVCHGFNSSQDIFQKRMHQTFERYKGAIPIADDMQVFGTDDNHDIHLCKAMDRVRSVGIKLSFEKCVIKSKSYTLFGDVYTHREWNWTPRKLRPSRRWKHLWWHIAQCKHLMIDHWS